MGEVPHIPWCEAPKEILPVQVIFPPLSIKLCLLTCACAGCLASALYGSPWSPCVVSAPGDGVGLISRVPHHPTRDNSFGVWRGSTFHAPCGVGPIAGLVRTLPSPVLSMLLAHFKIAGYTRNPEQPFHLHTRLAGAPPLPYLP